MEKMQGMMGSMAPEDMAKWAGRAQKVAKLHLEKVGAQLTKLSQEQANYIGVTTDGPFKPEPYRY